MIPRSVVHRPRHARDTGPVPIPARILLLGTALMTLGVLQPVPALLRLAEQIGHLPLERVEPLVERGNGGLGGRGLIREAGRLGRPAFRKDLALHLIDLPLEPLEALLGRRRLALGERRGGRERKGDEP